MDPQMMVVRALIKHLDYHKEPDKAFCINFHVKETLLLNETKDELGKHR